VAPIRTLYNRDVVCNLGSLGCTCVPLQSKFYFQHFPYGLPVPLATGAGAGAFLITARSLVACRYEMQANTASEVHQWIVALQSVMGEAPFIPKQLFTDCRAFKLKLSVLGTAATSSLGRYVRAVMILARICLADVPTHACSVIDTFWGCSGRFPQSPAVASRNLARDYGFPLLFPARLPLTNNIDCGPNAIN